MKKNKCEDHLGNVFESKEERANYWGLSADIVHSRLKRGKSLEEALTTPKHGFYIIYKLCEDHLGNKFNSITEMCEYWHIDIELYYSRKKLDWDLERILTEPAVSIITDHVGNEFENVKQMCQYWKITEKTYNARKDKGWGLEKILTQPSQTNKIHFDPIRNIDTTFEEISNYYNTSIWTVRSKYNKTPFVRIVKVSFSIHPNTNDINQTKYNLTIGKRIKPGKDVFECYIDNGDGTSTFKIMTYDMIDQYCLEQYKKLHNIV